MLLLSLATIPGAAIEVLFAVGPPLVLFLDLVDWAVLGIFAAEYFVKLRASSDKSEFVEGPANILSLLVVSLGSLAAIFSVPLLYSVTVLRVLRAAKLFGDTGHSTADVLTD